MEALLRELNSNETLPHNMILYTLGTLATSNPFSVVPHLKSILTTILPSLETVKKDAAKQAFSYGIFFNYNFVVVMFILNIFKH